MRIPPTTLAKRSVQIPHAIFLPFEIEYSLQTRMIILAMTNKTSKVHNQPGDGVCSITVSYLHPYAEQFLTTTGTSIPPATVTNPIIVLIRPPNQLNIDAAILIITFIILYFGKTTRIRLLILL